MNTPDVTKNQMSAHAVSLALIAAALAVDVSEMVQLAAVVGVVLVQVAVVASDALIRGKRAQFVPNKR